MYVLERCLYYRDMCVYILERYLFKIDVCIGCL